MKHTPIKRPKTMRPSQQSMNLVKLQAIAKWNDQAAELLQRSF